MRAAESRKYGELIAETLEMLVVIAYRWISSMIDDSQERKDCAMLWALLLRIRSILSRLSL